VVHRYRQVVQLNIVKLMRIVLGGFRTVSVAPSTEANRRKISSPTWCRLRRFEPHMVQTQAHDNGYDL
jgi:hypothetical protein